MRTLLVCGIVAVLPCVAHATEGGSSHFNPGTIGDFAMAVLGPPGFYLRNDLFYMDLDFADSVTLGRSVVDDVEQQAWVNVLKGIYLAPWGPFGSRLGAVVALPVVAEAELSGGVGLPPFELSRTGTRSGIGDMTFSGFLNWKRGAFHVNGGVNTYAPTGYYDDDKIINLGRNYWSVEPVVTFTWLHAKRGHEVSLVSGLMFNTENEATDYQSGHEWHLGFMLAQHFSPRIGVGLTGYVYQQISDDQGDLADLLAQLDLAEEGFRGEGVGLGPALKLTPRVFGHDVNLIGKWVHDLDSTNRFDGDRVFLSVAFGF